jgi:folate-dependent phosphoribosylglycinamide formyltransferase PurN
MNKIYTPKEDRPMSIVFFASNSEVNLQALHRMSKTNPKLVSVDLVVTDRDGIGAIAYANKHAIPVLTQNFSKMCGSFSKVNADPVKFRKYTECAMRFHNMLLKKIKVFEHKRGYKFDLAVLSYYRWIHGDLLKYFSNRMINQHPADLSVFEKDGVTRKYIGIDPAYLSIRDGKNKTRTSTILVRQGHDAGEILCQGPWCQYKGPHPITTKLAAEHERKQEIVSDIPSLEFAVGHIAKGNFAISDKKNKDGTCVLFFKGKRLPYKGVDLDSRIGK